MFCPSIVTVHSIAASQKLGDLHASLNPGKLPVSPMVCERVVQTVLAWQEAKQPGPDFQSLYGLVVNRGGAVLRG